MKKDPDWYYFMIQDKMNNTHGLVNVAVLDNSWYLWG
jgi:hypothetical protein